MPLVSVILPNYNYARYLGERIRSILQQTFQDFEFIIIDDASTDDSLAVIDRFADARTRLLARPTNSGRVYARWNEAAREAQGEYLLFAGADDYAEPHMLERLVAPLADPSVGFSHCRFLGVDGAGAIIQSLIPLPPDCAFIVADLDRDYFAPCPLEWRRLLVTNFVWNASGVLLRREAFERAGGFDADLQIAADWLLYQEIAREWDVVYLCEPLNSFRHLEKSVSKRMQGARLVDELFTCLNRQAAYVKDDATRGYLDLGYIQVDRALMNYLNLNLRAANQPEIDALLDVARRNGRSVKVTGGA